MKTLTIKINEDTEKLFDTCHDCGAEFGGYHKPKCDVERCPRCGGQYLSCDCEIADKERLPWLGGWA